MRFTKRRGPTIRTRLDALADPVRARRSTEPERIEDDYYRLRNRGR